MKVGELKESVQVGGVEAERCVYVLQAGLLRLLQVQQVRLINLRDSRVGIAHFPRMGGRLRQEQLQSEVVILDCCVAILRLSVLEEELVVAFVI